MILSRIDDDDFVINCAVQETRDILKDAKNSIIACGYNIGYMYFPEKYDLVDFDSKTPNGHMSIF